MLILLIVIVIAIYFLEKRNNIGQWSPTIILGGSVTMVMLLHKILLPITGFISLTNMAITITTIGVLCFWSGGIAYHYLHINLKKRFSKKVSMHKLKYAFMIITCICVLGMSLDLRTILGNRSLMMLEDQEFANNGLSAHLGNFLSIGIIYYIASLKDLNLKIDKKTALIFLFICLFFKFLTAIKGELILPLIGGFIYLIVGKYMKIGIKPILIALVVIFILFVGMAVSFNAGNKDVDGTFVTNIFAFYAFAGITGLSAYTDIGYFDSCGKYPGWIASFFINFFQKFFGNGELYSGGACQFEAVSTSASEIQYNSNVCTMIGEIYLNCGWLLGCFILFSLGWFSYYVFSKRNNSPILLILYSYLGACLCLNFFSTYIIQPIFYEIIVTCLFINYYIKVAPPNNIINQKI